MSCPETKKRDRTVDREKERVRKQAQRKRVREEKEEKETWDTNNFNPPVVTTPPEFNEVILQPVAPAPAWTEEEMVGVEEFEPIAKKSKIEKVKNFDVPFETEPTIELPELPSPWIPLAVGLGGLFLYNRVPVIQEWVNKGMALAKDAHSAVTLASNAKSQVEQTLGSPEAQRLAKNLETTYNTPKEKPTLQLVSSSGPFSVPSVSTFASV